MSSFLSLIKQAGTKSFRASATALFDWGGNAQNTDPELLSAITAPAGHSFVAADQAGAEALVVSHLCRAGRYRRLFECGIKPHTYVALHLFHGAFVPSVEPYWCAEPEDLKAMPGWKDLAGRIKNSAYEYDMGKKTIHAFSYDMRENTFVNQTQVGSEGKVVLSHDEAKRFLTTVATLFPEINELKEQIKDIVRRERRLENLFGFPRVFDQIITDGYLRDAISWIPQSTVACITHQAARRLREYVCAQRLSWRLFNNKHDSYAAIVPDAELTHAREVMPRFLAHTMIGWDGIPFTMKSEVSVGKCFRKFDTKNPALCPLGMKEVS